MNARLASLLSRVYRALSTDARPRAAMRIWHPAGGQWAIADQTLTLQVLATPRPDPVRIALAPPATLASIAAAILAAGWRVDDLEPELRPRGAVALLDQEASTTGPILIHDSILWAIFTAYAAALDEAAAEAAALPVHVRTDTATGIWPDYHGEYFGVTRLPGEPDATYATRIVAEVLRPKSNNLAMAAIISRVTGQPARVIDVTAYEAVVPSYDGAIDHDGTYTHSASQRAIKGLFDVVASFDLLGTTSTDTFQAAVVAQVERLRAAGTLLRQISLEGGDIATDAPGPVDSSLASLSVGAVVTDAAAGPSTETLPLTANAALTETAAKPADGTMSLAASLPTLADTAAAPADTSLPVTAAPAISDAATGPAADTLNTPLTLGPVLADAAAGPIAEAGAMAGSFAAWTEAPTGATADTLNTPLTLGPVLADTAAAPDDTSLPLAGSMSGLADAAAGATEAATLTQAWTHLLDGTWTLTGKRPLASTSPIIGGL